MSRSTGRQATPYTPQHHLATGTAAPAFRSKRAIAGALVASAVADGLSFRAVVTGGPCASCGPVALRTVHAWLGCGCCSGAPGGPGRRCPAPPLATLLDHLYRGRSRGLDRYAPP